MNERGGVETAIRQAEEALCRGAYDEVIAIADRVPDRDRPVRLGALGSLARLASTERRPSLIELTQQLERARVDDPAAVPVAAQALALEQRQIGVPGVISTCAEVLDPLLQSVAASAPAEELVVAVRRRWTNTVDRLAVAALLRISGQLALFVDGLGGADVGLERIGAAIRLAEERGSAASERAWLAYVEVLLYRRSALEVVLDVRANAMEVWRAGHQDSALRFGELAILHYYAGLYADARTWIDRARKEAAEHDNDLAIPPLDALACALDVVDDPNDDRLLDEFELRIGRLLDHAHLARYHGVFAAQFGLLLLDQGRDGPARRFATLAERSPARPRDDVFAASERRLTARLLAVDDVDRGRRALEDLRRDAERCHQPELARLVERDLALLGGPDDADGVADDRTVRVETLAPAMSIRRGSGERVAVRGQPAHLLALVIASGGAVAVEVVLEALWPGVDPAVGRNRLHGVLLRLRRFLGFAADGPLRCDHDIIEIADESLLRCDVWELPPERLRASASQFLSEQFPYDDRIEAFRRTPLRRR